MVEDDVVEEVGDILRIPFITIAYSFCLYSNSEVKIIEKSDKEINAC